MKSSTVTETKVLDITKFQDTPLAKYFPSSESAMVINPDGTQTLEKKANPLVAVGMVAGIGVAAYVFIVHILPLLIWIASVAIIGGVLLFTWLARKSILGYFKRLAKNFAKAEIKRDPFQILENERLQKEANKKQFVQSKASTKKVELDLADEAKVKESEAQTFQNKLLRLNEKTKLFEKKKVEHTDPNSEEYKDLRRETPKLVADIKRTQMMYNQAKDLALKYGVQSLQMAKLNEKMELLGIHIDIDIEDFKTLISYLKKEVEFSNSAKTATDIARKATLFEKDWEVEFALDHIATQVSNNVALTASNLSDIDNLAKNIAFDDEEVFAQLTTLVDGITNGTDTIVDTQKFQNVGHKLTSTERRAAGAFGQIDL